MQGLIRVAVGAGVSQAGSAGGSGLVAGCSWGQQSE